MSSELFEFHKDINYLCYKYHIKNYRINPEEVGGDFNCHHSKFCHCNELTTLSGSPVEVGGNFDYNPVYNLFELFNEDYIRYLNHH